MAGFWLPPDQWDEDMLGPRPPDMGPPTEAVDMGMRNAASRSRLAERAAQEAAASKPAAAAFDSSLPFSVPTSLDEKVARRKAALDARAAELKAANAWTPQAKESYERRQHEIDTQAATQRIGSAQAAASARGLRAPLGGYKEEAPAWEPQLTFGRGYDSAVGPWLAPGLEVLRSGARETMLSVPKLQRSWELLKATNHPIDALKEGAYNLRSRAHELMPFLPDDPRDAPNDAPLGIGSGGDNPFENTEDINALINTVESAGPLATPEEWRGSFEDKLGGAAGALPAQIVPTVAAGMIPGVGAYLAPAVGGAIAYGQTYYDAYDRAKRAGLSEMDAQRAANESALFEAVTGGAETGLVGKRILRLGEQAGAEGGAVGLEGLVAGDAAPGSMRRILAPAGAGGLEEMTQDFGSNVYGNTAVGDPAIDEDAGQNALIAAILGAGASGVPGGYHAYSEGRGERQPGFATAPGAPNNAAPPGFNPPPPPPGSLSAGPMPPGPPPGAPPAGPAAPAGPTPPIDPLVQAAMDRQAAEDARIAAEQAAQAPPAAPAEPVAPPVAPVAPQDDPLGLGAPQAAAQPAVEPGAPLGADEPVPTAQQPPPPTPATPPKAPATTPPAANPNRVPESQFGGLAVGDPVTLPNGAKGHVLKMDAAKGTVTAAREDGSSVTMPYIHPVTKKPQFTSQAPAAATQSPATAPAAAPATVPPVDPPTAATGTSSAAPTAPQGASTPGVDGRSFTRDQVAAAKAEGLRPKWIGKIQDGSATIDDARKATKEGRDPPVTPQVPTKAATDLPTATDGATSTGETTDDSQAADEATAALGRPEGGVGSGPQGSVAGSVRQEQGDVSEQDGGQEGSAQPAGGSGDEGVGRSAGEGAPSQQPVAKPSPKFDPSTVPWDISPEQLRENSKHGLATIYVSPAEIFALAQADINRTGRKVQAKIDRAADFLANPTEAVHTPEIAVDGKRIIIEDGYHRMQAAHDAGAVRVPVRIPREMLPQLRALGVRYLDLVTGAKHLPPAKAAPTDAAPEPAAKVALPPLKTAATGNTVAVKTEKGRKVRVTYAFVEADDLVASHDTGLRPNTSYPSELQPRDRDRSEYANQVAAISKEPRPDELAENVKAAHGAPIVSKDGVVESGNGRAIGLTKGYEDDTPGMKAYRDYLAENAEKWGLESGALDGMKRPVLVRVREDEMTDAERGEWTKEANEAGVAAMGPVELAKMDAERLTPEILALLSLPDSGDVLAAENHDFVTKFLYEVVPADQRNTVIDKDGNPSIGARTRIQNALFAVTFGANDDTMKMLGRLAEDDDGGGRNILKAMMASAPLMVRMRALAETGDRFDIDFAGDLAAAARAFSEMSARQRADFIQTMPMPGLPGALTDVQRRLFEGLHDNALSWKRTAAMMGAISDAIDALGSPKQGGLFGVHVPTKQEILDAAGKLLEQSTHKGSPAAKPGKSGQDSAGGAPEVPGEVPGAGPGTDKASAAVPGDAAPRAGKLALSPAQVDEIVHVIMRMTGLSRNAISFGTNIRGGKSTAASLKAQQATQETPLAGLTSIGWSTSETGDIAIRALIRLATDAATPPGRSKFATMLQTAGHEAMHVVFETLLRPHEIEALYRFAGERIKRGKGVGVDPNETADEHMARMDEALADWIGLRIQEGRGDFRVVGGPVRKIIDRVRDILAQVRSLLERHGFKTFASVFPGGDPAFIGAQILAGKFAGRPRGGRVMESIRARNAAERAQAAWHGSPHDHNKFSTKYMGTGEGVQAYGWGMYFAGKREVAEHYKRTLSNSYVTMDGERLTEASADDVGGLILDAIATFAGDPDAITKAAQFLREEYEDNPWSSPEENRARRQDELEAARLLESGRVKAGASGKLYKVELAPKDDEWLDWDKPLSEQSEKVRAALAEMSTTPDGSARFANGMSGEGIYGSIVAAQLKDGSKADHEGSQEAASRALHAAGIRGIRYLDGSSRGKGDGDHNYVVFDDADVEIVEKAQVKPPGVPLRGPIRAEDSPLYEKRTAAEVKPVTEAEANKALQTNGSARLIMEKGLKPTAGQRVGVRLNIGLRTSTGVAVQAIHEGTPGGLKKMQAGPSNTGFYGGDVITYLPVATLTDAYFNVHQPLREGTASGLKKKPMASADGEFVDTRDHNFDGVEFRFNPHREHLFVDRDGRALRHADEVTIVGDRVFARGDIEYQTPEHMPKPAGPSPSRATAMPLDSGTIEKAQIRRGAVPGLHSSLPILIDQKMPARASADQVRSILATAKQEEVEWTGLGEWLDQQKGSVTKEQVQKFLAENDVQIEEVELSDTPASRPSVKTLAVRTSEYAGSRKYAGFGYKGPDSFQLVVPDGWGDTPAGDTLGEFSTRAEAEAYGRSVQEQAQEPARDDTKYGRQPSLLTPGGENQRELLLKLPVKTGRINGMPPEPAFTAVEFTNQNGGRDYHILVDGKKWKDVGGYRGEQAALRLARDLWLDEHSPKAAPPFSGGHYGEPNVLAHIRFNDRTGPSGEKILHIEEIQSDWHQEGRKKGYATKPPVERVRIGDIPGLSVEHSEMFKQWNISSGWRQDANGMTRQALGVVTTLSRGASKYSAAVLLRPGVSHELGKFKTPEEAIEAIKSLDVYRHKMAHNEALPGAGIPTDLSSMYASKDEAESGAVRHGIPDAPFKSTWHELAFKRMLRYAAEHGYDKLTWTTGEQQADRYDLSKQVNSLEYRKNDDGTFEVSANLRNGNEQGVGERIKPEALADHVGKDVAQRMIDGAGDGMSDGWMSLSGLDLKVGGEGMRGFYDKMLHDFARKLGKKWGATVGKSQFSGQLRVSENEGDWYVLDGDSNQRTAPGGGVDFGSRAAAEAYIANEAAAPTGATVHSIDITPQMRESVMEGQPKFASQWSPAERRSFLDRLKAAADEARARIDARGSARGKGGLRGDESGKTSIYDDLADFSIIGAYHIAKVGADFAKWSEAMVASLGERVRPHLKSIFVDAKRMHEKAVRPPGNTAERDKAKRRIRNLIQLAHDPKSGEAESADAMAAKLMEDHWVALEDAMPEMAGAGAYRTVQDAAKAKARKERSKATASERADARRRQGDMFDEGPPPEAPPVTPSDEPKFDIHEPTWRDKKIQYWQDKYWPLWNQQKEIRKAGRTIPEDDDAYLAEEPISSKVAQDTEKFLKEEARPLAVGIGEAGLKPYWLNHVTGERVAPPRIGGVKDLIKRGFHLTDDLALYLRARHAPERNAYIASINEKMPDGGSGMTDAEAAEVMKRFEKEGKLAKLDKLAKMVDGITAGTRDLIESSGLESQGTVDAWRDSYEYYVSLAGYAADAVDDGKPSSAGRGKFGVKGPESKHAMGRESVSASPWQNAIRARVAAIERAHRNALYDTLGRMIEAHPNDDLWAVFSEDNPDTARRLTVRYTNPATGESSPKPKPGWNREAVVSESAVNMKLFGDKYIGFKRNGKQFYIAIHGNDRLRDALDGSNTEKTNAIISTLRAVNGWLAAVNVGYSLEFSLGNLPRDIETAIASTIAEQGPDGRIDRKGIAVATALGVPKAISAIFRSVHGLKTKDAETTKFYDEFVEDGVPATFAKQQDPVALQKSMEKLIALGAGGKVAKTGNFFRVLGDVIRDSNSAVENGTRLSLYIATRKAGLSRKLAASIARNATVNFSRRGDGGSTINAMYLFANPSIQSGKLMMNIGRTKGGRRVLGSLVGLGMMMGMLARAWSDDDEDGVNLYDKVGDHDKSKSFIVMVDGGKSYIKIPMGYGLNVPFVAGQAIYDMLSGHRSAGNAAAFVGEAVLSAVSPFGTSESQKGPAATITKSMVPTALKSEVEWMTNENYYGAPIYNDGALDRPARPDSSRSFSSTSEVAKWMAESMNKATGGNLDEPGKIDVSPDMLEERANLVFGGIGKIMTGTAATIGDAVNPEKDVDWSRAPFVRRYYGKTRTDIFDSALYYERREKIQQKLRHNQSLKAGPERERYVKENEAYLRMGQSMRDLKPPLVSALDAADDRLADLRKKMRELESIEPTDASMAAMKAMRMHETDELIEKEYKRFNKLYNERVGRYK